MCRYATAPGTVINPDYTVSLRSARSRQGPCRDLMYARNACGETIAAMLRPGACLPLRLSPSVLAVTREHCVSTSKGPKDTG